MNDQNIDTLSLSPLSESIQMYLVTILRLTADDKPVPLSQLGSELSVSPVSANEMCRKLQDRGLVIYIPYKGASLTHEGQVRAEYVLRRHRLWEVFLVDVLGFGYDQAHEASCHLEHSTPPLVADRLDRYLGFPQHNPEGELIPRTDQGDLGHTPFTLTTTGIGETVYIARIQADDATRLFLEQNGLRSGKSVRIIALTDEAVLVKVGQVRLSLMRDVADQISVTR